MKITKETARKFLIRYHGFDKLEFKGKEGVIDFINRVGCIQYDPLNVVGRNPDLVLQSRIKKYNPSMLYDLLYKDRLLLDGWDKQMAIYSVNDYPYFYNEYYLEDRLRGVIYTLSNRKSLEALEYTDKIVETIKEKGPMKPTQIDLGDVSRKGKWGHGKYSSVAMDYLYNSGVLVVDHKVGVQKVYDLAINKLPKKLLDSKKFNSEEELHKWHFLRRVGSVGIVWDKRGGAWQEGYLSNKETRLRILNELVTEGKLVKVEIEGLKEKFYIRKSDKHLINEDPIRHKMSFLAPLDNMLWDRDMIDKIFDFKYSWEVYIPVVKRKYGYYVLPVLYKDKIIARFEPVIDKDKKELIIKNWWYEDGIKETKSIITAREKTLEEFCKYLGITNYKWLNED